MEPGERVTQALSVSQVTWKEPSAWSSWGSQSCLHPQPHKTPSLAPQPLPLRKTTSYPHLPTSVTSPFKEPLKLIKDGSAQQTPRLDTPLPAQPLQEM